MYITKEIFEKMLASCGFNIVQTSETPKVQFYCLERVELLSPEATTETPLQTWREKLHQDVHTRNDRQARYLAAPNQKQGRIETDSIIQPPKLHGKRKNTNTLGLLQPRTLIRE